ncbi:MBL fold metallo-hydrolase [Tianweitania sp.]|uniref:MBL fold metallo-hydrolase n=1 Tax=Tianweitania sp. TaxID=2021634 RepID=UPI0028991419|nr:MBL fold metallo-hydrolase [Tianweitania sp.]
MADRLRLTILGCGSSPGVPRPNGDWGACDPSNPKNKRKRAAALVERISDRGVTRVVIDTGPDFREQMIAAKVDFIDAVVLTHAHADHIHGIDDLRSYYLDKRQLIDVYADQMTFERVDQAFGYCYTTPPGSSYPPILRDRRIQHFEPFTIEGKGGALTFEPLSQQHGDIISLGFRLGSIAYCSDVSQYPDATAERLNGLDCLVIDALQYRSHPSHFSLSEALGWIKRLAPKRAVLTHMHVPLDYDVVERETPDHVSPAFDGLVIEADCVDQA